MIDLTERLNVAKRHSDAHGVAFCPAHDDKRSPSLSYRDDGNKWLLHCFAGCDTLDICEAIGIEYRHLFHDGRTKARWMDGPQRANPRDALATLDHEAVVVLLIAEEMQRGRLADTSLDRLALAIQRIGGARLACRTK